MDTNNGNERRALLLQCSNRQQGDAGAYIGPVQGDVQRSNRLTNARYETNAEPKHIEVADN